jgi:ABC-2 type transport system permease protein
MLLSFGYYMSSFTFAGGAQVDLAAVGLTPDMTGYALLAASLFLSIISALALAVLLAAYTKDVRSAQSLLGVLFLPIFIPAFLLMYAPIEILPAGLQAVLYAIPFSYPSIASKALYTKDYAVVALGVVYQLIFTAVVLIIAARFFASEKIMTAKLRWGRKRKAETEME